MNAIVRLLSFCAALAAALVPATARAQETTLRLVSAFAENGIYVVHLQKWLQQLGNPYAQSLMDADGRIGIDYGVYGVPETFVIDKQGVVRFKHVGPITPEVLRDKIEPLVRQLST